MKASAWNEACNDLFANGLPIDLRKTESGPVSGSKTLTMTKTIPRKSTTTVSPDNSKQTPSGESPAPSVDTREMAAVDSDIGRDGEVDEATIITQAKKNKKKKKKDKHKQSAIGSARGIETMFRTSYQAQLDMIALATTKSNIMISLNGVLISVLLLSAAYLINTMPMLIVPIGSLLLTCTVAIVFAVLAARPGSRSHGRSLEDARNDQGVLLIFDDFARFPADQYTDSMMDMLRDHQRVYRNMVAHIHDMGQTANEKFGKLYISYSTFMVGLVVSVVLLLVVVVRQLVAFV